MTGEDPKEITPELIRATWTSHREKMNKYIKEEGGLTNAVIRILAENDDICRSLLEGKKTVPLNKALRHKYINKIAFILRLPRSSAISLVLENLGEKPELIKIWNRKVRKRVDGVIRRGYHSGFEIR